MAIHEIQAKQMLSSHGWPDPWFGRRDTLDIYRGCQHGCIYCDSCSLRYGIEAFDEVPVMVNARERLADGLPLYKALFLRGAESPLA